jgi:hypothetical protein
MALCPRAATAVHHVDDGFAAVELTGRLQQDRDLLGAVQVHRTRLRELEAAALADRGVARDVAVVDGDSQDLRQQVDVHVDRACGQRSGAAAIAPAHAPRLSSCRPRGDRRGRAPGNGARSVREVDGTWEWLARRVGQRDWRQGSTAREAIRQAMLLAPGKQPKWLLDAAARASAELEDL